LLVASLLVIPILVIEGANVGETWKTVGDVLNWVTWLMFLGGRRRDARRGPEPSPLDR
jgi:hypothetical protein